MFRLPTADWLHVNYTSITNYSKVSFQIAFFAGNVGHEFRGFHHVVGSMPNFLVMLL